jgi:site-specific DNA-methyltransferase (adenine-specific)
MTTPETFKLEQPPETAAGAGCSPRTCSVSLDLRLGDCMDIMKEFADGHFDLAIVDPPYRDENQPTQDMRKAGSMATLTGRPTKEYFAELMRVSKQQIIWGANNFELPQFKGFIVWEKGIPMDFTMSMAELAAITEGLSTISKIVRIPVQGQKRIHPTQKPVALYDWILANYAKPGWNVLDTHLGSGSIAIACHYFGAHLTACEIDPKYFSDAKERIKRETAQLDFFSSQNDERVHL